MTEQQKIDVQTLLNRFCEGYESQAKAAIALGISDGTIINMRRGTWEQISDDMWRKVAKQVGYSNKGTWKIVPTAKFNAMTMLFDDAKEFGNTYAIISEAGSGKTAACDWYHRNHKNVYHIQCAEFWSKKDFLASILEKMGKDASGSIADRMNRIVETIIKQETPVILLDEADKLSDSVLYFFITLYNQLADKCGIVMLATSFLEKRIVKGVRLNKKGYEEVYSRLGRRFIELPKITAEEVSAICTENGIKDLQRHTFIYNDSSGDLRRVSRAIHKEKAKPKK